MRGASPVRYSLTCCPLYGSNNCDNVPTLLLALCEIGDVAYGAGYGKWGFSGSVTWQPNEYGRGVSINPGSSWGVTASGVNALWTVPTPPAFPGARA